MVVFQNLLIPTISSDLLVGLTSRRMSVHAITFPGDSGGVFHQCMCSRSKKFLAFLDVCLGALVYVKQGMCPE